MKGLARLRRLVTLIFLSLFLSAPLQAVPQYEVTDIGALLGSEFNSRATAINNEGHVAGYFWKKDESDTNRIPFIYRPDSGVEVLEKVQDQGTEIIDLNDRGEFIGVSTTPELDQTYFINRNGAIDSHTFNFVRSINNNGDVVGSITTSDGGDLSPSIFHAALLKADGTLINIAEGLIDCDSQIASDCDGDDRINLDFFNSSSATDINDKGQILFTVSHNPGRAGGPTQYQYMVYTPGQGYKKWESPVAV